MVSSVSSGHVISSVSPTSSVSKKPRLSSSGEKSSAVNVSNSEIVTGFPISSENSAIEGPAGTSNTHIVSMSIFAMIAIAGPSIRLVCRCYESESSGVVDCDAVVSEETDVETTHDHIGSLGADW